MSKNISHTISAKDFPFWDESASDYDYQMIADVFFRGKDRLRISKITGVSQKSVCFDKRMPNEVKEFLQSIALTSLKVYEYFDFNFEKMKLWFELENPLLSKGISPKAMILIGRHEKLDQIIISSINGDVA